MARSDVLLLLCTEGVLTRMMRDGSDGSLHVWDLVDAKQLLRLRAHRGAVGMVCCHPTRHDVLTASHDGTAKLWKPEAVS